MSGSELGMTKREMERELAWILRNPPANHQELTKLFAGALVTLLEKNNVRIAEQISHDESPDIEEDF